MTGFLNTFPAMTIIPSADLHERVALEGVGRHLQIQRRWSTANASRRIVFRAVARAEPATKLAAWLRRLLALGHTAKMRADANQDQPFRLLGAHCIGLRITKTGWIVQHILGIGGIDFGIRRVRRCNLFRRAMA